MRGLTGQVHSMALEEGDAVAMAWRRARRRQRSAGVGKGGRGRPTGPDGPKGLVGRLAAGPIRPEAEKNPFRIKIGFLNVLRLWKFAQGHLGGILTQGFFINSSRILKDFRKIQYAMP
jgi:hypothetical protein